MLAEWYYAKGNQRHGPFTEVQLREYAASGQLLPTDMVWKQGMPKWEQALTVAGLVPPLPVPPLPALPPLPPPLQGGEPTAPKQEGLLGLLLPFLSEEKRKALQDFFASWRQLRLLTRIGVIVFGAAFLALIVWQMFRGGESSGSGIFDRIWQSGAITGLVSLTFAFMRKKLVDQPLPSPATVAPGQTVSVAAAPEVQGEEFLGLSSRQWLSLLVALFLPTVLASLVSTFLIGSEIHYWLTGPILVILGLAIAGLSAAQSKSGFEQQAQLGAIVGGSPVLFYALSCLNARWVLLLYTLLITLPALQLFIVCRRNVPALRFIMPLKVGIAVLGLVLFLGIMALPRAEESGPSQLVGTWVKAEEGFSGKPDSVSFNKGGSATLEIFGSSLPPAKYTYSGKTLEIEAEGMAGKFTVDFVSDKEIVLVAEGYRSRHSPLVGRWKKKGAGDGTGKDNEDDKGPNLNSPLASKLVGKWKSSAGESKDSTVEFTKAGKVIFIHPTAGLKGGTETVLGNYSFKKDAVLQLDKAGDNRFDKGWRVDIEFIGDDEILFVNHGIKYRDFGPLAGRFERRK